MTAIVAVAKVIVKTYKKLESIVSELVKPTISPYIDSPKQVSIPYQTMVSRRCSILGAGDCRFKKNHPSAPVGIYL